MLDCTAAQYLTQLYNAYMRGSGALHRPNLIKVSPELFKQFEDEHTIMTREMPVDFQPPPVKWLAFKTTKLKADPGLTGISVWIGREDE